MTILDELNEGPSLRRDRTEADKVVLSATVQRVGWTGPHRRSRHVVFLSARGIVAGIAAAGLLAGAAAAAVLLTSQRPTVFDQARCYSEPSTDFASSFPGTTVSVASAAGAGSARVDVADQALEACAAVWRQGLLAFGAPGVVAGDGLPDHPVPALTACVLPSGEAAVYPGSGPGTCRSLGLPPMTPEKSGPAKTP